MTAFVLGNFSNCKEDRKRKRILLLCIPISPKKTVNVNVNNSVNVHENSSRLLAEHPEKNPRS